MKKILSSIAVLSIALFASHSLMALTFSERKAKKRKEIQEASKRAQEKRKIREEKEKAALAQVEAIKKRHGK